MSNPSQSPGLVGPNDPGPTGRTLNDMKEKDYSYYGPDGKPAKNNNWVICPLNNGLCSSMCQWWNNDEKACSMVVLTKAIKYYVNCKCSTTNTGPR